MEGLGSVPFKSARRSQPVHCNYSNIYSDSKQDSCFIKKVGLLHGPCVSSRLEAIASRLEAIALLAQLGRLSQMVCPSKWLPLHNAIQLAADLHLGEPVVRGIPQKVRRLHEEGEV